MKLLNNLKGLITEIAAISDITDAVKNKKVITIYYNGKDIKQENLYINRII